MAKRKIVVKTNNSDWQAPKKKRKPRKPMSEEQRVAAAARLEKTREKRKDKNPDYGKSGIHESLRNLPDEHQLSPKKIKEWIKTQKEFASIERKAVREKVKGSIAKLAKHEGYIHSMTRYLKNGDWTDMFYGEHQEKTITRRCTALAYYWYGPKKGEVKRNINVYYPDMGCVYTKEMLEEDRETENVGREREAQR